jgi:hypothetical protein
VPDDNADLTPAEDLVAPSRSIRIASWLYTINGAAWGLGAIQYAIYIGSLIGFTVLAIDLVEQGNIAVPVISVGLFSVFAVAWIMESAFHTGVTVWAVKKRERDEPVPELLSQLDDNRRRRCLLGV